MLFEALKIYVFFCVVFLRATKYRKKWKSLSKEMNKELKVVVKVLNNIVSENSDTKNYVDDNLKEICEGDGLTVDKVIYLGDCLCLLSVCLSSFRWIVGLILHELVILFRKVNI